MVPSSNFTHRFTKLRASTPSLSDAELLNSNNLHPFSRQSDVVVAGAGIIGLCYAIQLKTASPHLDITVFEKSNAPVQKIGESTLSSFSRFTNGTMLPHDYMFRLFGMKDGLQFYCVDEDGERVTCEDVGGLDISFQLDRRMSELFFTMWAQSIGVKVYHGVGVDFDTAYHGQEDSAPKPFHPPTVKLKNSPPAADTDMETRLVCDASGFSRKLTSKFGPKQLFSGWNCDAYWAYFKTKGDDKAEARLHHWDYPATKHICFPEGWGWFIKLISWHKAHLANLMDMCTYLIDNAKRGTPASDIMCTKKLSRTFGCPFEYITSIGWAVRDDYTFPADLELYGATESERKFHYFQRKYPTLDEVMNDVYELLPEYYGKHTYFARKGMAYRSPIVAGDGWFAIGNSAGFTNPLISPSINAGIETAFLAAQMTRDVLQAPEDHALTIMRQKEKEYQAFSHDFMMPRLWQMNKLWYTAFRDHGLFDALVKCFWACGVDEIGTHYKTNFDESDLRWLVGAGNDHLLEFCAKLFTLVDPQGTGLVSADVTRDVRQLSRECIASRTRKHPQNAWGRYVRKYDDSFQLVEGKRERDTGGNCSALRCRRCSTWMHDKAGMCPVCGTKDRMPLHVVIANATWRWSRYWSLELLLCLTWLAILVYYTIPLLVVPELVDAWKSQLEGVSLTKIPPSLVTV